MTGSRHGTLQIGMERPLGQKKCTDGTDHLRGTDDPAMAMAIGPQMPNVRRDTDVALCVSDMNLLVVLGMHDKQGPVEASCHGNPVQLLDTATGKQLDPCTHGRQTCASKPDSTGKVVEHVADAGGRTDDGKAGALEYWNIAEDSSCCHHHGSPAKRVTNHPGKGAELPFGGDDRLCCNLQIEAPTTGTAMAGQIKQHDLRPRSEQAGSHFGQILRPRTPTMHNENPGCAMHGCRRIPQEMRRSHATGQSKAHRLGASKALRPLAKHLLCLKAGRVSGRSPTEKCEGQPPGSMWRQSFQLCEGQAGDLEGKGCHSRGSDHMFNIEQ